MTGINREQQARAQKVRVGIFVLVALAAFLGLIYLLGARAKLFEARYVIHAEFTEVGGLTEGATVRLAGVQIGRVTGVWLPSTPGGKVRIDMSIARQYGDRVRKDSVARIDTQGLLGDKIVEITVGTGRAQSAGPGDVIQARDPTDITQVLNEGAATVKNVAALAESLRTMTDTLRQTRIVEDAASAVGATRQTMSELSRTAERIASVANEAGGVVADARRITGQLGAVVDEVQKGRGWAHALLYDEPIALRRLDELIKSTQAVLDRVDRGEGAVGVLTSPDSTQAARRLVAAMDRLGRAADGSEAADGLLPGLLFDPKGKAVLDDLSAVARNLRDVSDRIAGGRGTLGSLVRDEPGDGGVRQASRDLQDAVANLKAITEKLNDGEGTLGALIADPSLYDRLVKILDGAQRSFLLRALMRGLGRSKDGAEADRQPADRGRDRRPGDASPAARPTETPPADDRTVPAR